MTRFVKWPKNVQIQRIKRILKYRLKVPNAILPRKGPVTRVISKRLQEDWARAAKEGPRVLMNLRVDL